MNAPALLLFTVSIAGRARFTAASLVGAVVEYRRRREIGGDASSTWPAATVRRDGRPFATIEGDGLVRDLDGAPLALAEGTP